MLNYIGDPTMIAKTIFSLIIATLLGLTITAVYADTPTYEGYEGVAHANKIEHVFLTVKRKGTFLINCRTYPDRPYKGVISLSGDHELKFGDKVRFKLQTTRIDRLNTLILYFKGSEDLESNGTIPIDYGFFMCTYKKIK